MSVEKVARKTGTSYRVRWREGGRNRARSFGTRRDAQRWDLEVRRRAQLGTLHLLDAGAETLDAYVTRTWAPAFAAQLAPRTRRHYVSLYDHHVAPTMGATPLRSLTPELVARWQADRLAQGAGPVAVRHALALLGSILQRAFEAERIPTNPVRQVRKAKMPRREEVRPLAPVQVEAMRSYLLADGSDNPRRDAALVSVLAYAGLRPGEALGLRWGDVGDATLLVQRSIALGEEAETKTGQHRSVRLLAPLRADLAEWRLAAGRPGDDALVFPGHDGRPWQDYAYQSWRRRAFRRAREAAGLEHGRPYDLRHSFASLLLHEGRNVIYVARQLGHDAQLTLGRYGHVMETLEDEPRLEAETAIRRAREQSGTRLVPVTAS
ncbi:MAG: tyrosine-type recombinase/integrase [Thermoleophilaceae bacterium]